MRDGYYCSTCFPDWETKWKGIVPRAKSQKSQILDLSAEIMLQPLSFQLFHHFMAVIPASSSLSLWVTAIKPSHHPPTSNDSISPGLKVPLPAPSLSIGTGRCFLRGYCCLAALNIRQFPKAKHPLVPQSHGAIFLVNGWKSVWELNPGTQEKGSFARHGWLCRNFPLEHGFPGGQLMSLWCLCTTPPVREPQAPEDAWGFCSASLWSLKLTWEGLVSDSKQPQTVERGSWGRAPTHRLLAQKLRKREPESSYLGG